VTILPEEAGVNRPRTLCRTDPLARASAVAKSTTKKLKLYSEGRPAIVRPQIEVFSSLPEVLRAFQHATGWSLRYVAGPESSETADLTWSAPVNPGVGTSLGHLRLDPIDSEPATFDERGRRKAEGRRGDGSSLPPRSPIHLDSARSLASAIAGMLHELRETRHVLWQREAELAASVPLPPHPEDENHLAARLEAVLKGGAEAVGCQAAALFMLDDATTELKLRSCWGLPFDRLTAPARRLRGAIADLEALLGHAVVLEDPALMRHWNVPEDFPAAICVPVSTPTTLLGTLWVFCTEKRPFDDRQTNILEVVAGRLAADLEREVLVREGLEAVPLKRQLAAAERLQRSQLPTISPLLDGWQIAGWTAQSQPVGGDFHDWFCLPNGLLAVVVGHSRGQGIEAAMAAVALKAAVRAHGRYHREAQQALRQINFTLWTGSAGDQSATLFYALIETATGRVCCASAGEPAIVQIRSDGWESLSHASACLGESPETDYEQFGYELPPGQSLAVFTEGVRDALDRQGRPLGEAGIADALASRPRLPADQLLRLARKRLDAHAATADRSDRTILVIRRTPA